MGVESCLFWSSSMRIGASFWKMIVEMPWGILSNWGSRLVHKKKKRKMLTPGIEPGLPKPQSGVLPLYYVSFLINTLSRCISHQSRHVRQESPLYLLSIKSWANECFWTFDEWGSVLLMEWSVSSERGSFWLSVGVIVRQQTSPLQRRLISQDPHGHRLALPWLD